MRRGGRFAVLCRSAIEQAVFVAEGDGLSEDEAYLAVTEDMVREAVVAAIESGHSAGAVTRIVAEAIVETGESP